jgi:hypothetical protein
MLRIKDWLKHSKLLEMEIPKLNGKVVGESSELKQKKPHNNDVVTQRGYFQYQGAVHGRQGLS